MLRLELAVFSARGVETYALAPGAKLVVGRGDDADVRIVDDAVSRRHAVFHAGPPLEVEDLGSANGTYVTKAAAGGHASAPTGEQKKIAATRATLDAGDSVFFGGAVIVVRAVKEARDVDRSDRASEAGPIDPALESIGAVVTHPASRRLYDDAARVAATSIPVLILGETGAGKEVLARWVHKKSPRDGKPFLALNCAAISETLAESQLFGHEKGAFTGATQARAGVFESARGGTVFLDEIGELAPATQAKLLRALESGSIERLGSVKPIAIDARFVSATNRDLEHASKLGTFRRDLYFRVNGATLRIPPLRDRASEVPILAARFLAIASRSSGRAAPAITGDARDALMAYAWPGNVRELRWTMERALVAAGESAIGVEHLPPEIASRDKPTKPTDDLTKERVIEALRACDQNQTRAAEALGVSRRTLINRMIAWDLPRPRPRKE